MSKMKFKTKECLDTKNKNEKEKERKKDGKKKEGWRGRKI